MAPIGIQWATISTREAAMKFTLKAVIIAIAVVIAIVIYCGLYTLE